MPAPTAHDVYVQTVRSLPLAERLRLAALILDDLAQPNVSVLEMSDSWSEQDERDLSTFSLRYAATLYPEGEEPE
jgi:hypothetical protein